MKTDSHKIKFTKFFPVKSPLGLNQKESPQQYPDVGIDIYFPEVTEEFLKFLEKNNQTLSIEIKGKRRSYNKHLENKVYHFFKDGCLIARYNEETQIFQIYDNIQIPTGLGFLIPHGYYFDLRSKSSNFKNGYTEITGLIDENYTFSCGVQIIPINNVPIEIKVNEKFSQLVLRKAEFVSSFEEVKLDKFEELQDVKERRLNRIGGFGSTGKF